MAKVNTQTAVNIGLSSGLEKAADYREFYVNNVRIALTPNDLALLFGHIFEKSATENIILEDVAIRMSPQFCKALSVNLANAMAAWEGQFGPVTLVSKTPQDIQAGIQAAMKNKGS